MFRRNGGEAVDRFFQAGRLQVGVNLGGLDAGVPHELGDFQKVHVRHSQVRCKAVAQRMERPLDDSTAPQEIGEHVGHLVGLAFPRQNKGD